MILCIYKEPPTIRMQFFPVFLFLGTKNTNTPELLLFIKIALYFAIPWFIKFNLFQLLVRHGYWPAFIRGPGKNWVVFPIKPHYPSIVF
ncbi:MAG: hypothetical protein Ct9H300mP11_00820 [Chloroflexota bacterium]|nr:MAG: hypothetical protein Ct9H300mP11_00820 [Chloroflexota bacterium]